MARIRKIGVGALIIITLALSVQTACAKTAAKAPGLWVGGYQYFSEFQSKALNKSGAPRANLIFRSTNYFDPSSIAFDSHDDLWTTFDGINFGPQPVVEIKRADLPALKNGKLKPSVIIEDQGSSRVPFSIVQNLAFDAADDLWVADGFKQAIMDFLPNQIKKSGGPSPNVMITAENFVPGVMRFDGADNLWVTQFPLPYVPSNADQLWRFAPADRASSGPANPGLIVELPDGIIPADLAFDRSGNLWFAGGGNHGDAVEMISASDLNGTGEISPSAKVTITSSAFGLLDSTGSCLGGIDFDDSGDLWISVGSDNAACHADSQVIEFTPSQLSAGGNLEPSVTLSSNSKRASLFFPGPIRFGPAP